MTDTQKKLMLILGVFVVAAAVIVMIQRTPLSALPNIDPSPIPGSVPAPSPVPTA